MIDTVAAMQGVHCRPYSSLSCYLQSALCRLKTDIPHSAEILKSDTRMPFARDRCAYRAIRPRKRIGYEDRPRVKGDGIS